MPYHRRISEAEINYLKELMHHIEALLDSASDDVLEATADTSLEFGITTTFRIEVRCDGNQVMKP